MGLSVAFFAGEGVVGIVHVEVVVILDGEIGTGGWRVFSFWRILLGRYVREKFLGMPFSTISSPL